MSEAFKKQTSLPLVDKRKFRPQNFIHTSLFSEVYVFNDLPHHFENLWNRVDDNGRFDEFFSQLVSLMSSFSPRDAENWNHTQTLNNLIYPMFEILGFGDYFSKNHAFLESHPISMIGSDGNQIDLKPSVLICEDENGKNYIKKSDKNSARAEIRKYLKIPVVTSYYGSTFDRKSSRYDIKKDEIQKKGDVFSNLGPSVQMSEYLNLLDVPWGIFTDGAVWRLFRKEASNSDTEKFYEFDFSELYNLYRTSGENASDEHSEFFEVAKYLFWFFSYNALVKGTSVIPFIESVYQKSQVYVLNMEDDLKERFVHAMTLGCNGYLRSVRASRDEENLKLIAKTCESLIFNLIFIRACESKRVLPIHQDYVHVSLKALVDKIRHFSYSDSYEASAKLVKKSLKDVFDKEINDEGYELYDYIKKLHGLVDNGDNGFGITGFVESVYYPEEKKFFTKHKISNAEMIRLLYQLFYISSSGKNIQIPYNLITPRQLGSIFESFLEFQPIITNKKLYYVRKKSKDKTYWQWEEESEVKKSDRFFLPCVDKGEIVFSPDNIERKTSGSYYTPDHVVNYMVKKALEEQCDNKSVKSLLSIKICDPSMGSGHFLLGAMDFIAKKIAERTEGRDLTEIKREVLDACIFGVDINPSAVKLGRMSLWLATALPGRKLERLTDQLKIGNSIIPRKELNKQECLIWKDAFDWGEFDTGSMVFIGNPPWGAKFSEDTIKKVCEIFRLNPDNLNSFEPFLFLGQKVGIKKSMFIIPRNFIRTDGYVNSRKKLVENHDLEIVADFGPCFDGVTLEAVCLGYVNESKHSYVSLVPGAKRNDFNVVGTLERKSILKDPKHRINISGSSRFEEVIGKIDVQQNKLSSYVEHYRGIEYGKNGEVTECKKCGSHQSLPKKKNRTKKCSDCGSLISISNATSYNFISKTRTKTHTIPMVVGKVIEEYGCKDFYYMQPKLKGIEYKEQAFRNSEKIMIMKISDSLKAYLDTDRSYSTQGIYMLYLRPTYVQKINLSFVTAILNSPIMKFYYEYKINMGASLTTNVILEDILNLPFPSDKSLSMADLNKLETLVISIQESKKSKLYDDKSYQMNLQKINDLVFKAYGLSKEEAELINQVILSARKSKLDEGSPVEEENEDEVA